MSDSDSLSYYKYSFLCIFSYFCWDRTWPLKWPIDTKKRCVSGEITASWSTAINMFACSLTACGLFLWDQEGGNNCNISHLLKLPLQVCWDVERSAWYRFALSCLISLFQHLEQGLRSGLKDLDQISTPQIFFTCLMNQSIFTILSLTWANKKQTNFAFTINDQQNVIFFGPHTFSALIEIGELAVVAPSVSPLGPSEEDGLVCRDITRVQKLNTFLVFLRGGPQFAMCNTLY